MDIDLARTFLAVVTHGSFVAAGERLHLTSTAVSARIRSLEEQLDARLFVRDKSGARLTMEGERFVRHATTLIDVWEGARQQVARPAGRASLVSLGGEPSLWNPLLAQWAIWMHRECPEIAVRAEVDIPGRLVERVLDGSLDMAILYGPQQRPNLIVELLAEERLVMVTTDSDGRWSPDSYVHVDWGPTFTAGCRTTFPELASPAVSMTLGPLALTYLLAVGGSGYFRAGAIGEHVAEGRLRTVPGAPEFSHSVYSVYTHRADATPLQRARAGLRLCARSTES